MVLVIMCPLAVSVATKPSPAQVAVTNSKCCEQGVLVECSSDYSTNSCVALIFDSTVHEFIKRMIIVQKGRDASQCIHVDPETSDIVVYPYNMKRGKPSYSVSISADIGGVSTESYSLQVSTIIRGCADHGSNTPSMLLLIIA